MLATCRFALLTLSACLFSEWVLASVSSGNDASYPSAIKLPDTRQTLIEILDRLYFLQVEGLIETKGAREVVGNPFQPDALTLTNPLPPSPPSYLDRGVDYLLRSRDSVSVAVRQMGTSIDQYFAGERYRIDHNESYILVRASQKWSEGGELEPEWDLKFRLDLPGTKERFRFVLSYRDEDDESLEEQNRPSDIAEPQQDKSFFAGLASTVGDMTKEWEHKLSAGIKARFPPDPFARVGTRRQFQLGNEWEMNIRLEADWLYSRGANARMDWRFERFISEEKGLLFRSRTPLDYREENDYFEFGQVFSVFHFWSPTEAIEWQLGAFGRSLSHSQINTYYTSLSYRNNIYSDWLFVNLIPELAFERKNEFSGVVSITAGFEFFFF